MLCSGDCNVLWSVDALKGSFLSLPLENSSDASIHLKHKWLMMWCSAVVQLTPVQIYGGKTRGWDVCGNAFVVLTLCDCKWWTSQLQTTTKWGLVCNKKKEHELSSQNIQMCEIQMPHGTELLQHLFSLQLDESIWSIDVNKLELICFKYPLKVNWHCWNRCMCVYGIMDSNVVF